MKVRYTAEALATGDGRNGSARSSDGRVDVDLAVPREMGGSDLPHDQALAPANAARQVCPYSNATRGNIDIELKVANN